MKNIEFEIKNWIEVLVVEDSIREMKDRWFWKFKIKVYRGEKEKNI